MFTTERFFAAPVMLLEYCDISLKDWLNNITKVTTDELENMLTFSLNIAYGWNICINKRWNCIIVLFALWLAIYSCSLNQFVLIMWHEYYWETHRKRKMKKNCKGSFLCEDKESDSVFTYYLFDVTQNSIESVPITLQFAINISWPLFSLLQIIHRRLAMRNVLLKNGMNGLEAKLIGFGPSRDTDEDNANAESGVLNWIEFNAFNPHRVLKKNLR